MIRRLLMLFLLASLPRPTAAQDARPIEIAGGAAVVRDTKNEVNLPRGWFVSGAVTVIRPLSIVVEAGGGYRTLSFLGADAKVSVITIAAGPRFTARLGKLREFGQVLVGRASGSGSQFSLAADTVAQTPDSLASHVVVQPGIGLDYPIAGRLAFRLELDARAIGKTGNGNENGVQFRLAAGLAYALRR